MQAPSRIATVALSVCLLLAAAAALLILEAYRESPAQTITVTTKANPQPVPRACPNGFAYSELQLDNYGSPAVIFACVKE